MNGIKKAALFLSSLDFTEADLLLSRLDASSAKLLRREIMSLRHHSISAEESYRLDEEFLHSAVRQQGKPIREHQFAAPSSSPSATYAVPQRPAVKYPAESFITPVQPFGFLESWSIGDIAAAIVNEHPQTIAVILAHLPKSRMQPVLSALPENLQNELQRRLDYYEMPDKSIIQEIESALKMRYRIQHRPVRRPIELTIFEDIETLTDTAISTLLHSVDLTTAMLALIGADSVLIERITKLLSPTEEHEMRRRLKTLGSVDAEDIEQARQEILEQYNATL